MSHMWLHTTWALAGQAGRASLVLNASESAVSAVQGVCLKERLLAPGVHKVPTFDRNSTCHIVVQPWQDLTVHVETLYLLIRFLVHCDAAATQCRAIQQHAICSAPHAIEVHARAAVQFSTTD
jgi:hypothetical protein